MSCFHSGRSLPATTVWFKRDMIFVCASIFQRNHRHTQARERWNHCCISSYTSGLPLRRMQPGSEALARSSMVFEREIHAPTCDSRRTFLGTASDHIRRTSSETFFTVHNIQHIRRADWRCILSHPGQTPFSTLFSWEVVDASKWCEQLRACFRHLPMISTGSVFRWLLSQDWTLQEGAPHMFRYAFVMKCSPTILNDMLLVAHFSSLTCSVAVGVPWQCPHELRTQQTQETMQCGRSPNSSEA